MSMSPFLAYKKFLKNFIFCVHIFVGYVYICGVLTKTMEVMKKYLGVKVIEAEPCKGCNNKAVDERVMYSADVLERIGRL